MMSNSRWPFAIIPTRIKKGLWYWGRTFYRWVPPARECDAIPACYRDITGYWVSERAGDKRCANAGHTD